MLLFHAMLCETLSSVLEEHEPITFAGVVNTGLTHRRLRQRSADWCRNQTVQY